MTATLRTTLAPEPAILLADLSATLLGRPAGLLPLLGKSLLHRAVERLVERGHPEIHVLLGEQAGEVRALLAGGERWGCRILYHYLDDRASFSSQLRAAGVGTVGHCWLADATCVPFEKPPRDFWQPGAGQLLCWDDRGETRWSGWGRFSGAWLLAQALPPAQALAPDRLLADPWLASNSIAPPLDVRSPAALLDSLRRLLEAAGSHARLPPGPGSQVDAGARLIAPYHLGRNVKIGAGACIGPYAVIEDGAFVDRGTVIANSLVLAETYVGPELELDNAIAGPGLLANARLDAVTEVQDPDLLAALAPAPQKVPLATRALAGLLRIGLSPLYLWLKGRVPAGPSPRPAALPCPRPGRPEPGPMHAALEIPAPLPGKTPQGWSRHFCRSFYPGLRHVMHGELRLVGPSMRSLHEVRQLPPDWRRLYADSRGGLLSEGLLLGAPPRSDEDFASDALAAAQPDRAGAAWRLVLRYLRVVTAAARQECPAAAVAPPALHPEDAA